MLNLQICENGKILKIVQNVKCKKPAKFRKLQNINGEIIKYA